MSARKRWGTRENNGNRTAFLGNADCWPYGCAGHLSARQKNLPVPKLPRGILMREKREESGHEAETIASYSVRVYDTHKGIVTREQTVIREKPVALYFNEKEFVTLLCAGNHLDELAIGFFYAEGLLQTPADLTAIRIDKEAGKVMISAKPYSAMYEKLREKRTITSGCGKGTLFYNALDALLSRPVCSALTIRPLEITRLIHDLNTLSDEYRQTHGVHNCALASPDRLLVFRDDIGRHNAVDMIVGHAFLHGLSLADKLLVTTGRLTSEIIIKAGKIGIPLIVSRNTATALAIEIAQTLDITLVGYARAGKFTVYTGHERISDSTAA
jgi:FdhD protein